jgi:hypothetical protein
MQHLADDGRPRRRLTAKQLSQTILGARQSARQLHVAVLMVFLSEVKSLQDDPRRILPLTTLTF